MTALRNILLGSALCAGALIATNVGASAAIVCSGDECWHTHTVYEYPTTSHVIVHDDNWTFGDNARYRWREHEGRGFWHGDSWEDF